MKKIYLLFLAAAILVAGSCGTDLISENIIPDEDVTIEEPAETQGVKTITAVIEGSGPLTSATSSTEADGLHLSFAVDDEITVYKVPDGTSSVYTCTAVAAGIATFDYDSGTKPDGSDQIVAVYCPGSTPAYVDGSNISITTEEAQTASTTGYSISSIPLVAYGTVDDGLTFKSVGGALEVSLDIVAADTCCVESITVTAQGDDYLSGVFNVNYTAATPTMTYSSGGAKIQTYTYTGGIELATDAKKFYIGLPAGTHNIKIRIIGTDGGYMEKTGNGIEINTGKTRKTTLHYAVSGREISTEAQLRAFADYFNKHGILNHNVEITNDINISSENWTPIGTNEKRYDGVFDGNGFTVTGLKIPSFGKDFVGLIGFAEGATIQDLNLSDVTITTTARNNVGAVVGRAINTLIDNCHVLSGNVKGNTLLGGIAGTITATSKSSPSIIRYCSNAAKVTATQAAGGGNDSRAGGILGVCQKNGHIIACWNTGAVIGDQNVGGVTGSLYDDNASDFNKYCAGCYNTGVVTAATVGGITGRTQPANEHVITNLIACYNAGDVKYGSTEIKIGACVGNQISPGKFTYNINNLYYVRETDLGTLGTRLSSISALNASEVISAMNDALNTVTTALFLPNYQFVAGATPASDVPTLTIVEP